MMNLLAFSFVRSAGRRFSSDVMPRRSSGGRPAPRPAPRASSSQPLRQPPPRPQPVHHAPPPAHVQPNGGGSMLGGIGSTIAQGMAFGTGSAVAHRAVDAVLGPRVVEHQQTAADIPEVVSATSSAPPVQGLGSTGLDSCSYQSKAFQDCIIGNGSDISKCQFYLDMLNECRKGPSATL